MNYRLQIGHLKGFHFHLYLQRLNTRGCRENRLGSAQVESEIFRSLKEISPRLFHGSAGPALQGRCFL